MQLKNSIKILYRVILGATALMMPFPAVQTYTANFFFLNHLIQLKKISMISDNIINSISFNNNDLEIVG